MPEPKFKPPRYFVIEGPIRVGKSTLAKILAERLHARRVFDCEDNPFLGQFYDEQPGAAFRAQMYFLMERHQRLMEIDREQKPGPVVSDFLFEKDKIFAYINLENEELKIYERYYEMLAASVAAPDLVIYLQAKPEVLRQRISKKAARNESNISPDIWRRSPRHTSTFSSVIQVRICWSWTLRTSTSSSAIRTCRSCYAASASQ